MDIFDPDYQFPRAYIPANLTPLFKSVINIEKSDSVNAPSLSLPIMLCQYTVPMMDGFPSS